MDNFPRSCKYLHRIRYMINEIGGNGTPTYLPEQWKCDLDLEYTSMPWDKCQQTSFNGPCWQMINEFPSIKEWDSWVKSHLKQS